MDKIKKEKKKGQYYIFWTQTSISLFFIMQIFIVLSFLICFETMTAMLVPNENLPFDDGNLQNQNQFLGNEESPLDSDRPRIRIRINTNGGNASPYILFRRRPNSNMRLRIKQGTNSNIGLFRILYRRKHQSISQKDDHENGQPRQEARQRIIFRPETRDTSKRIIIQSRRPSKLRIASGMFNNIRFHQY